jgi:hypothetical protein
MALLAPGRFSTTTLCPHRWARPGDSFLANTSTALPGPAGSMIRTVLLGKFCAKAGDIKKVPKQRLAQSILKF